MNLNYKEYGHGEPVIILHGLLGMLDNWHSFSKSLSDHFWVIAPDQRNHGKSFHSDQFDYPLLSDDLLEFMDSMHIPRCHLLGHSMGGKTVMQFLNDHSDRVEKAIIVDIAPKKYSGGHEKIFKALLDVPIHSINSRSEVQSLLMNNLKDLGTVMFLLKNLDRNSDGSYSWKANVQSLNDNYANIVSEVVQEIPVENEVLFVKGERSNYILPEDQPIIQSKYPNSEIVTIADAGHWVHADQADELLHLVYQFLHD